MGCGSSASPPPPANAPAPTHAPAAAPAPAAAARKKERQATMHDVDFQDDISELDEANVKVHVVPEHLFYRDDTKQIAIKAKLDEQLAQKCTFSPTISNKSRALAETRRKDDNRLYAHKDTSKVDELRQQLEHRDMAECHFAPKINPRSVAMATSRLDGTIVHDRLHNQSTARQKPKVQTAPSKDEAFELYKAREGSEAVKMIKQKKALIKQKQDEFTVLRNEAKAMGGESMKHRQSFEKSQDLAKQIEFLERALDDGRRKYLQDFEHWYNVHYGHLPEKAPEDEVQEEMVSPPQVHEGTADENRDVHSNVDSFSGKLPVGPMSRTASKASRPVLAPPPKRDASTSTTRLDGPNVNSARKSKPQLGARGGGGSRAIEKEEHPSAGHTPGRGSKAQLGNKKVSQTMSKASLAAFSTAEGLKNVEDWDPDLPKLSTLTQQKSARVSGRTHRTDAQTLRTVEEMVGGKGGKFTNGSTLDLERTGSAATSIAFETAEVERNETAGEASARWAQSWRGEEEGGDQDEEEAAEGENWDEEEPQGAEGDRGGYYGEEEGGEYAEGEYAEGEYAEGEEGEYYEGDLDENGNYAGEEYEAAAAEEEEEPVPASAKKKKR